MYSPALTKRTNNAMIARKELKRLDPSRQAFVKYQATLMVRKFGKKGYRIHLEYQHGC